MSFRVHLDWQATWRPLEVPSEPKGDTMSLLSPLLTGKRHEFIFEPTVDESWSL